MSGCVETCRACRTSLPSSRRETSHALSVLAEARQHLQGLAPEEAALATEDGDHTVLALLGHSGTLAPAIPVEELTITQQRTFLLLPKG